MEKETKKRQIISIDVKNYSDNEAYKKATSILKPQELLKLLLAKYIKQIENGGEVSF